MRCVALGVRSKIKRRIDGRGRPQVTSGPVAGAAISNPKFTPSFDQSRPESVQQRTTAAEPDRPSFSCSIQPSVFSSLWCFSTDLSPWRAPLVLPAKTFTIAGLGPIEIGFRMIAILWLCADEHRVRPRRHGPCRRHRSQARIGETPVMPATSAPAGVKRHAHRVKHPAHLFR